MMKYPNKGKIFVLELISNVVTSFSYLCMMYKVIPSSSALTAL